MEFLSSFLVRRSSARILPLCLGGGLFVWALFYFALPPRPFDHRLHPPSLSPPHGPHSSPEVPTLWTSRANEVRDAYLHAYNGYQQYAANHDELAPITNRSVDNFNGWGVTLIDSLDTMWLMGLDNEFNAAVPVVANMTFFLDDASYAPFFETVIRYLGGLLSAYALSGEPIFLSRADDLGKKLLPAFNTTSGLPMYAVNTVTGKTRPGWQGDRILWAESLSCQLEYKYLAHLTGRREYYDKVEKVMDIMQHANVVDGVFPTKWYMETGTAANTQFSVGAFADSAHEYLLKQWLLTGQSEPKARHLYMRAVSSIISKLLYLSPVRQMLYVTDTDGASHIPSHKFEHLSCFLPGLLALGAHTLELPPHERELHEWAARGLAHTCWLMYADQASGLGPDEVFMKPWPNEAKEPHEGRWYEHLLKWEEEGRPGGVPPGLQEGAPVTQRIGRDYSLAHRAGYYLRPETLESFYIMWKTTGDVKWKERGWTVFQAIQKEARTKSGYASLNFVDQSPTTKKNEMPSFFMAETLKYLYLMFSDADLLPIQRWVLNTEAHPFPVFEWRDWEKEQYGLL